MHAACLCLGPNEVCAQLPKLLVEPCIKRESAKIWYAVVFSDVIFLCSLVCIVNKAYDLHVAGTDQVVLGDLVYCKGDNTEKETAGVNSECDNNNGDDTYDCSHLDEASGIDLPEKKNTLVKVVTTEDISTGNYTVDDVVLPMPGSRVIFPTNEIAKVYHDLAKKDGINLTESVHGVKEFSITSMTGSYRRVFQKALDFEWELLTYNDSNKPLAETDLDKISKVRSMNIIKQEEQCKGDEDKISSDCTKRSVSSYNGIGLPADTNGLEGEREVETQMALKLSLTLPSSCYATMAIRELLKTSTSVCCIPQNTEPVSKSRLKRYAVLRTGNLLSGKLNILIYKANKYQMGFQLILGTAQV
ncbi:unnamed protein product [Dovyalis caffra]|uniref:Uncharacterized protein n=1 Tax=Dovyalis caffra TaxID=77055 RepID=A0AAV1RYJ7_9ROSI|nr:unnamed protein product [Dovyalis caffra]